MNFVLSYFYCAALDEFTVFYTCFSRATEECQTYLTVDENKEISGNENDVTFDPLDDSLLLVKV